MGGGGENAAEFPELFWCGVSALHTDIEHELLVALVLMKVRNLDLFELIFV